jgi:hypothetical protein
MDAARWLIKNNYATGTPNSVGINIGRAVKGMRKTAYGFK